MKRVLFQGDSITDAGRDRERFDHLGAGYPKFAAGHLDFEEPGAYECLNRGISGNRIVDVYARIKRDIINLAPDYMSILIGVNDVWHEVNGQNGVEAEKFERIYDMLIGEIKEALPNIKIMIMSPYVIKGTATEEKWDVFRPEVELRCAAAKRIAEKYQLPFVDLLTKFDEATARGANEVWSKDGVHPVAGGIELIKHAWLDCFKNELI